MEILKYLLLMIGGTLVWALAFPFYEYFYQRLVNKETYSVRYFFSHELFDFHLDDMHSSNMCHVINNREELADMWEKEMKEKLP